MATLAAEPLTAEPLTAETYPPPLTEGEQDGLVQAIKDWSMGNGLAVRPPPAVIPVDADPAGIAAINAPVTLFPSPFPRRCFDQAKAVQPTYNELYASVSRDEEFLGQMVKEVLDGDDFIRNLWQTHLRVKEEGYTQPLSLGLFRSDYMVHRDGSTSPPSLQAKQVEFNTIASSFGGLSSFTSQLHSFLASTEYPLLSRPMDVGALDLPECRPVEGLAAGIEAAFHAYAASELGHPTCVVFLVQSEERNVFDQRHLEYQIVKSSPTIPVFRLPFADILTHTSVAETAKRQLLYRLPRNPTRVLEVAVVYMRAGYGPGDYPDRDAWEARYQLERSAAIKCPTVLTQLAGTKKVQQVLAAPKVLARFIDDETTSAGELWKTFTNIYPMDRSDAGLEARKKALDAELCQAYVLKPQREGGGNNIYRGAIPDFLRSVPEEHWGSYILMELIVPPPVSNLILRNGRVERGGVICELGVYGTCLWNQGTGEVLRNEEAGYLLRTKGDKSEEGGVAAGYGCMDSCALV
ncbi:glutathione synthetase-like protein [Drechmeria coniospora]|uniref:Glutathione synthetase n=1 Tax=Drechmeria coniospora TaxID=98403 RepID=A0A151GSJ4_DRECN|nr:glutathione synthetase-like protein [Drechmeria coniospora]KYK60079.1 glutathione synthetase-like protein [Drechmeria coniospora]